MRYISTEALKPDMVLGKTIFTDGGSILLSAGQQLKQIYIDKIKSLNYSGIYINDEISKDIEIYDIISDRLRMDTVRNIKKLFIEENITASMNKIQVNISDIVNDIISNRNVMVNMIDLKTYHDYTYYHSVNVTVLALAIGVQLGLNKQQLEFLGTAGMLHDIGKRKIPKEILDKPSKLTPNEFEEVKKHSFYGYEIVKAIPNMSPLTYVAILQHHEKYDGSGYPNGIAKDKISLFGRILAIADVYDAIISNRPYHKPVLPSEAIEYIMGNSGIAFDPQIVQIFIRKIAAYPVGTRVELSNGLRGIVIKNFEDANTRPVVRVINPANNVAINFNLKDDANMQKVTISKVLNI